MRARGAQVTDIAVLVVAADDGVMPQTIEALNHAQAADVPIVVAVNKVDKEDANPAKVRQQLTEYGLVAEEYGGETLFIDVSAKAGLGLDKLLEAIVLTADAALDLRANPTRTAEGVAIEAHLDRGRGPVATVLVQRGTLHVGDSIVAGDAFGRVRAMLNENGDAVDEAGPSRPVQVLGFTSVPGAGDNFLVVPEDRVARQIAEQRQARERFAELAKGRGRMTLEDVLERIQQGELNQLNLILKGDVSGSVEALEDALLNIEVGNENEVSLRVIGRGVGAITENDINLARASDAVVIGYNVRPEGKARELAEREKVDVRFYSVIYAAIDDVESALKGMLKPEFEEVQLGTAEIREVFRSSKAGNIAGCIVRDGTIVRNSKARLVRDGASWRTTSRSRRCGGSRTTRPRSARASSAVSVSATTTTSTSTTSSRPSSCGEAQRVRAHEPDGDAARTRKMSVRVREIVASVIERQVKDARLGMVTITDVRMTPDLHEATVFWTVWGDDAARADSAAALESAEGRGPLRGRPGDRAQAHAEHHLRARRDPGEREADRGAAGPRPRRGRAGAARSRRRRASPAGDPDPTRRARQPRAVTDGLVVVDKPAGWTSHDVVGTAAAAGRHPPGRPRRHPRPDGDRRTRPRRRPGDPAARASRADDKDYDATIRLGRRRRPTTPKASRSTGIDAAAVDRRRDRRRHAAARPATSSRCRPACRRSRSTACAPTSGCATARAVELEARPVTVDRFELVERARRRPRRRGDLLDRHLRAGARPRPRRGPWRRRPPHRAAPDPGRQLRIDAAKTLEAARGGLRPSCRSPRRSARAFPRIDVTEEEADRIGHGQRLVLDLPASPTGVFAPDGRVIALVEDRDGVAQPLCVFV